MTERPCLGCGARTPSENRMCRTCTHTYAQAHAPRSGDDDYAYALQGGQWVPRDGIMRWEADVPLPADVVRPRACRECGSAEVRQFLCEKCALESDRRSKREYARRVRSQRREAA